MTHAPNIEKKTVMGESICVDMGRRFRVILDHTAEGLSVRVYPRTAGELWDYPVDVFEVSEADIIALEADMEG